MNSEQRAAILAVPGVTTRKKIKQGSKPFPGLGKFVILGRIPEPIGGEWTVFEGANTIEAARRKSAQYGQWTTRLIVPNEAPETIEQPLQTLSLEVGV